jgi:predicted permease
MFRGGEVMDTFLADLKYSVRMLIKRPGFSAVAVLTLALAIGANTTIFTLINAVFLHALPVADAPTLVDMWTVDAKNTFANFRRIQTSWDNYKDYAKQSDVFSALAAHQNIPLTLSGRGEPQQLQGFLATTNYFDVLGVKPQMGRTFHAEDGNAEGANPVVVVSYSLWGHKFGADPNFVGQTVTLNGTPFTVIGVMPPGFKGAFLLNPSDQFWIPMGMHKQVLTGVFEEFLESRRALFLNITGRLKPGVSITQAEATLKTIAKQLEKEYPNDNEGRSVELSPIIENAVGVNFRKQFVLAGGMLLTVTGLVLLIACVNIANLLLARAASREKEISVRTALGASRGRLVRQLLTESVVLSIAGGLAGLLVAYWSRDLLWSYRPPFLDADTISLDLDARVLFFTFGIALLTGVLFGLIPALRSSRPDLIETLKVGGRQGGAWGHNRLRSGLVVAELALALVALVGAGLFVRSMQEAQKIDPGFETKNLAVMGFDVGAARYTDEQGKQFYKTIMERAAAIPGVASATVASNFPLAGGFSRSVFPEGTEHDTKRRGVLVTTNMIAPNFFETLHMQFVKGRLFNDFDTEKTTLVAIINEAMAKKFWPGEEAVGKRFAFFGSPDLHEVVGVVKTTVIAAIGEDPQPQVFLPIPQYYQPAATLQIRTTGDPSVPLGAVRNAVQQLDRNLPLVFVQTIGQVMDQGLWAPRMGAALLGLFGLLSLVLAAVGVYGVMSYSVTQRTQEFGIRMALGAEANSILRLVVAEGAWLAGIGLTIGLVAAAFLTRLLAGFLFGVKPGDPATFGGVSLLLAGVALLACFVPARRATRVDPLVALRYE